MGLPILRKPGEPTPCRLPIGCPKGTPEDSKALTEKNAMAYRHYLQCKATGNFPKDEIVALHAGIIRSIEDDIAQGRAQAMASFMRAKL